MNPDDAFERILASLYEAMLDDAHWPETCTLIDEACDVGGTALVVGDRSGGPGHIHFAQYLRRGEIQHEQAREYFEVWYPKDPSMRRLMGEPQGRLFRIRDLFTEDELKGSEAYNEGWRVLDARNGLSVHFDDPDGLSTVWFVGDPAGGDGWQSGQLALIERLKPHVRQFVRVRQALAAAEALGAGLAGLLENDRIGVVQLDRGARVLAANGPALEILRRGDGLTDRDGALDAWLPAERGRLRRLLGRALPGFWGEAPAGGSMTVQRSSGRTRLGLHVSPVGDMAADFGGRRVAALVLLVDPERRPRIDAGRVAAMLGLTESEGRAAALLAEGLRVREIAGATGWKESYVHWLIKQAYQKTGVRGQPALVRQVLTATALPRR